MNVNGAYSLAKVIRRLQWMPQHSVHTTGYSYEKTHYETLNLSSKCTSKDIRDAFITLSKRYHPDKNHNDPNNHARFVALNEAYSVLSKPEKRRDYDMRLGMENRSSTTNRPNYPPNPSYRKTGFPQYSEYSYQRVNMYNIRNHNANSPRVPTFKVLLFIFMFTLVGGVIQFFVIKYMFNVSHARQMDIHNRATAHYQALQQETSKRLQEEKYRVLSERYDERMDEMRRKRMGKD